MNAESLTSEQIASLLHVPVAAQARIARVSGVDEAAPEALVFAEDAKTLRRALATRAGLILADDRDSGADGTDDPRVVRVHHPRYAFAVCAKALGSRVTVTQIHPLASVDPSAKLGERLRIGAGAIIEAGVTIGDDTEIASGAVIQRGVVLGSRVVVQSGAVLGATGFGYVRNPASGEHMLFPQQGSLVVEDDVEIGANTTIDRGALGETRIGQGTKIDNQVHIGHNCRIGRNVLIAAQVGISGSCVIEDGAVLAGQVGLGDHVSVGPGVILGGSAGVFPGKRLDGPGQMFMGIPAEPLKSYLKTIAWVRRLVQTGSKVKVE